MGAVPAAALRCCGSGAELHAGLYLYLTPHVLAGHSRRAPPAQGRLGVCAQGWVVFVPRDGWVLCLESEAALHGHYSSRRCAAQGCLLPMTWAQLAAPHSPYRGDGSAGGDAVLAGHMAWPSRTAAHRLLPDAVVAPQLRGCCPARSSARQVMAELSA